MNTLNNLVFLNEVIRDTKNPNIKKKAIRRLNTIEKQISEGKLVFQPSERILIYKQALVRTILMPPKNINPACVTIFDILENTYGIGKNTIFLKDISRLFPEFASLRPKNKEYISCWWPTNTKGGKTSRIKALEKAIRLTKNRTLTNH